MNALALAAAAPWRAAAATAAANSLRLDWQLADSPVGKRVHWQFVRRLHLRQALSTAAASAAACLGVMVLVGMMQNMVAATVNCVPCPINCE